MKWAISAKELNQQPGSQCRGPPNSSALAWALLTEILITVTADWNVENYWWINSQQIMIMNLKLLILIEIPTWAPSTASTQEISVGRVFPSSAWVSTLWLLCEGGAEKGEQWSTTVPPDSNTLTSWHWSSLSTTGHAGTLGQSRSIELWSPVCRMWNYSESETPGPLTMQ